MVDPNPVTLFHVYSAVLMSVSGMLYRAAGSSLLPTSANEPAGDQLHALITHLSFFQVQLQSHAALIQAAGAAAKYIYPIGKHSLILAPNQIELYVDIRNGVLNAAPVIIRECASMRKMQISASLLPLVGQERQVLQYSAREVFLMKTFGEAFEVLRAGFSSSLYIFHLIRHETDQSSWGHAHG